MNLLRVKLITKFDLSAYGGMTKHQEKIKI